MTARPAAFTVTSEVTIAPQAADDLARAFRDRLHLVEDAPGFQRLEVWRDLVHSGVFQMVSWWDTESDFRIYMRSAAHDASHDRVPVGPERPRGTGVRRYALLEDR
jgi:heme-degrading monooxygenase HmoA